ncbi:MAG: UDP-N-acetylmuramoyl-L-alanine--D-glutamate ligase [Proteobacteria bacterium]|nr:UDP-N-acetylmuramoyl-L-alanine--D-glutamate ligase [Pseudomonadota bacterium]
MIECKNLLGKTYAVLGLGKSGLATLAALKLSGARVLAWDDSMEARMQATRLGFSAEDLTKADWKKIDLLILSPGIPHTLPAPHPAVAMARKRLIEIIGDIELLFRCLDPAARPRLIAVTGTNGKSTTTALIAHILGTAGRRVEAGGNLGIPALSFNTLPSNGFYVIEMSSFQCELTPSADFDAVVWLNITPDHLDRHGDMAGYVKAKKNLFKHANKKRICVIGVDDEESRQVAAELVKSSNGQVIPISAEHVLEKGVSAVNSHLHADGKKLFSIEGMKTLPGTHNAQNAAAAFAVSRAMGIDVEAIQQALFTYPGLAHRQQLVRTMREVRFINDSKATNADAAGKALACYENIYWILGGKPKEGGLKGLESFMPRIRHAFLIGKASDEFAAWLEGKAAYTKCGTLEHAVKEAAAMAASEGKYSVVLLSPACASYDQFKNYEQRGEKFVQLVAALPEKPKERAA